MESGIFEYCTFLKTVIIPKSIIQIDQYAFYGCNSLRTVKYEGTAAEWNNIKIYTYNGALTNYTSKYYNYEYPISIIYKSNGGIKVPNKQLVDKNSSTNISTYAPFRKGYKFIGWSTSENLEEPQYQPGDVINIKTDDIALYAIWAQIDLNANISSNAIIINTTNMPPNSLIILSLFLKDTLVDLHIITYEDNTKFSYTPTIEYDSVAILAVENIKNIIPLCKAKKIYL